jgi:hypothetical protein
MGIKKNGFLIFGMAEVYNFLECSKHYHERHAANYDFFFYKCFINNVRKVRNSNYAEM